MQMKVSEYIAEFIRIQKIEHVFEVAGGMITHLLDALHQLQSINIISVHHEQAAAFAADAYGRITGKPGIALATSGPGATNLLTGIASCYFDSSPAIFITGQVNTYEQKGARKVRQLGFQETDIIAMAAPIVKKYYQVISADQVELIMQEAYECSISNRPGPVLIDLPMNIQREQITVSSIPFIERKKVHPLSITNELNTIKEQLQRSKRPLILLGNGIKCADAKKELIRFVEKTKIPVVTSLLAIDVIPFEHPLRTGFIGTYGNRWANIALSKSDLLIVIGSRLDVRQTGADANSFRKDKIIFHIDCDKSEINNRITGCIPIVMDVKDFLNQANAYFSFQHTIPHKEWIYEINLLKHSWPDTKELKKFSGINPNNFMHVLSKCSKKALGYIADVGNHQMWAAQSLEIHDNQIFMTSGGMGAMGFALPAAIGASFSYGKKPIVVIVGDGALQMNIQELQTIARNHIPLKIIVMNNNCLGMIRQFQDSYFEGRYQSTYWGYTAPDFSAIAKAYGIDAKTISNSDDIDMGTNWLWEQNNEPVLLQVMISHNMNVYPKIAFGRPICEMEPFADPISIEST